MLDSSLETLSSAGRAGQFAAARRRIPLAPALAALTVPERMLAVIRRQAHQGQPTTREDFRQAEETCDLSDGELDASIGDAKRLANPEVVRHDRPQPPVNPWDHDPEYRKERVAHAAGIIAGLMPNPGDLLVALRQRNFSTAEIGALWPEIIAAAAHSFSSTELGAR
jgi:hypothetical protein